MSESAPLKEDEIYSRPEKYFSRSKDVQTLEGLRSVLKNIKGSTYSKELSHYIWDVLINKLRNSYDERIFVNDTGYYFYYKSHKHVWQSCTLVEWLREYKWLYVNGKLSSVEEGVYKEDLIQELYTYSEELLNKLCIESSPNIAERESISQMSEETQEAFEFGDTAKQMGVGSKEELEELIQMGRAAKQANEEKKSKGCAT